MYLVNSCSYNRYDDNRYAITDPEELHYPGRDYTNFSKFSESNQLPNEPPTNSVDRTSVARTPWHDISVCVEGPSARGIARSLIHTLDVSFNFMQKWNHVVRSLDKDERQFLVPKSQTEPQKLFIDKTTAFPDCTVQIIR